jgi:hypothetical protein
MNGEVGILNVGAGDTKLTFDKSNPAERERAARIVADMLKRGYALLVQVGKKNGEPLYQRAKAFDPKTCEYIVAGGPDEAIDIGREVSAPARRGRPRRGRPRRIQAERTRAVAVGRTAGG